MLFRSGFDAFDPQRQPMGVTGHAVYQSVDNPNDVTVWHDFATAGEAQAFMASEALKKAMQNAGVQGAPSVWLTNVA